MNLYLKLHEKDVQAVRSLAATGDASICIREDLGLAFLGSLAGRDAYVTLSFLASELHHMDNLQLLPELLREKARQVELTLKSLAKRKVKSAKQVLMETEDEQPAFEIFGRDKDFHIKIYASGRVEGVDGSYGIINRIYNLIAVARAAARVEAKESAAAK